MPTPRLISSASFRLTSLYLALFTASAIAVDGFVYVYIQHSQLRAFADRVEEETDALVRLHVAGGRARLIANLDARVVGGGSLVYGLYDLAGRRVAGRTPTLAGAPHPGWSESPELDEAETVEAAPDVLRMLTTRLNDGDFLVVGDERTAVDNVMRDITRRSNGRWASPSRSGWPEASGSAGISSPGYN